MPIQNTPLTPAQFDALQVNITEQSEVIEGAATIAQSGLQFVVLLQEIPSEVDLVNPFADHLLSIEGLNTDSNFTAVVASLNQHLINRGTTAQTNDTFSTRLNRWFSDNGVQVSSTYARISSGAGYIIDSANIEP